MLSDDLIKVGLDANPKNNRSQGEQSIKMLALIQAEKDKGTSLTTLVNITKYAIRKLNEKGFWYYKLEIFFDRK